MAAPRRFPRPILERLAADGCAHAQLLLAMRLGDGAETKAQRIDLLRSASATLPRAQCQLAEVIGESPEAAALYRRAVAGGDRHAPAALAFFLRRREAGRTFSPEARRLLRMGAARGDTRAAYHLGYLALGDRNCRDAEHWFRRADLEGDEDCHWAFEFAKRARPLIEHLTREPVAEWARRARAGDARAGLLVALSLLSRRTGKEEKLCEEWMRWAERCGDSEAKLLLALSAWDSAMSVELEEAGARFAALIEGGDPECLFGAATFLPYLDRPSEMRRVPALMQRAAEGGHALAALRLADMFLFGRGRSRHPRKGVHWLRVAAARGVPEAQFDLATRLGRGRGMTRDAREAVVWMRRAAEQGYRPAMVSLGVMLHEGRGVRRDDRAAVRWYRRAARQGDKHALANLGRCAKFGHGMRRNAKAALRWFRRAAFEGNGQAACQLVSAYAEGWVGRPSAARAIAWERHGAVLGDRWCLRLLSARHEHGDGVAKDRRFAAILRREASRRREQ